MDRYRFDLLTPKEREILLLLTEERSQKTVARRLDLSPETVKTHLRNAREKCDAPTSFDLARAYASHLSPPPNGGIPRPGGLWADVSSATRDTPDPTEAVTVAVAEEVHEARAAFRYEALPGLGKGDAGHEGDNDGALRRLSTAGVLVLLIVAVLILAFPLAESFQRLADVIDPPR